MRKKKNKNTGRALIYSRYILPLLSDLILIISMFIPCINYILDNDVKDRISIFTLIQNSWDNARHYLFSSQSSPTPEGTAFYQAVFTTIIVVNLLFILALATDIFGLVAIIKEDNSTSPGKARILYSTFIPNRFVLCLLRLPVFPIIFFPNIVELLYRNILLYPVSVNYNVLYPWILALVLFAAQIVFLVLSKKFERRLSLDLLSKNILSAQINTHSEPEQNAESKIYTINSTAGNRNANIRQMFSNDDEK